MKQIKNYQKGIILILLNSVLWGISPLIIKVALFIIPPFVFLFYRFLWVTLIKFIELIKKAKSNTSILKDLLAILGNKSLLISAFLFNFVTLAFYFKGLYLVTPLQAGVLAATSPLFVILPMVVSKKEKLTKNEVLGIFIMLLGYIFLILAKSSSEKFFINWLGVLYITLGNLANAIAIIINKKYLNEANRVSYEFISIFMALIGFFGLVILLEPNFISIYNFITGIFNLSVIYMAIFGTLVALSLFNKAMLYLEASETISFLYAQPLFLALLEVSLGQHPLNYPFVIGILFLLFGIIFNILGIIKEHESD